MTVEVMSVTSYIDYPEFRTRVVASCKSTRASWTNGGDYYEGVRFPYRFVCGKLADVTVSWDVLSTERKVVQAKKSQLDRNENTLLLEEAMVEMWVPTHKTNPIILPEEFFSKRCHRYKNLNGNSNILLIENNNMRSRVKIWSHTKNFRQSDWKSTNVAPLKSNVTFNPGTHSGYGNCCCIIQ